MSESFPLANYGLPAPNSWQVARITNDLEPKDLIRTQRDVTGLILAAIQEEPEGKAAGTNSLANLRHYDGLRSKYNLWDKAVQRNLATVGLLKLASHGNDDITGRSITGIFVVTDGAILDWVSRHQPYVSLHSGEAETIAASISVTHALYLRGLEG